MHYSFERKSFCDFPDGQDAVEVSEEERHALLDGQARGARIVRGEDGRPTLVFPDLAAPTREAQAAARRAAYSAEADPLFFRSQRGEAHHEEWLAKIAEIRARYPYPT